MQGPHPDRRRLVTQQQRRDEMRLIHRLEHLDGVEHPARVRVGQFLHQCFDRGGLSAAGRDHVSRHRPGIDAGAERPQVFALRPERHRDPEPGDGETGIAQLPPVQPEPPGLDAGQQQQRRQRFRAAVHRDVDERFDTVPHLGRQRQEEHFTRRLVERVAHRRAEHPGPRDRPERTAEEDDRGAGAEADRQQEQGDTDPGGPIDAADERNLDDESADREVGGDLGQEGRNAVAAAVTTQRFGRHVELLVDDGRAGGGACHRQGQHLQRA